MLKAGIIDPGQGRPQCPEQRGQHQRFDADDRSPGDEPGKGRQSEERHRRPRSLGCFSSPGTSEIPGVPATMFTERFMSEMGRIDADVHIAVSAVKMDAGRPNVLERMLCYLPENGVIQLRCEFSKRSIVQIIGANKQRVVTLPQDSSGNFYQGLDVRVVNGEFLRTDEKGDPSDDLSGLPTY
ncbi:MAG: hypothetical protein QM811_04360 [Pirellulales bacterium]